MPSASFESVPSFCGRRSLVSCIDTERRCHPRGLRILRSSAGVHRAVWRFGKGGEKGTMPRVHTFGWVGASRGIEVEQLGLKSWSNAGRHSGPERVAGQAEAGAGRDRLARARLRAALFSSKCAGH
eukprot:6210832-Pleurochrysis_carterae.AAC.1